MTNATRADKTQKNENRREVRGRYAPSPTGPLHLGNARTALLAWLQTRLAGGVFVMRMEDLDLPRVKTGSAQQILRDLRWLGLDWDEGPDVGGPVGPYTQSERVELYRKAFADLRKRGRVFPCTCSRRDIASVASAPHGEGRPLIYAGTCRQRTSQDEFGDTSRQCSWRYRVFDREICFEDRISGPFVQNLAAEVGDFVLLRSDGLFAYQLAVVVDDGLMGITDVVRGADLLESAPRQIELFQALSLPVPEFWHMLLMLDDAGRRMSKRDGSETIAAFRGNGGRPEKLIGEMAYSVGLVTHRRDISAKDLLATLDETELVAQLRRSLTSTTETPVHE